MSSGKTVTVTNYGNGASDALVVGLQGGAPSQVQFSNDACSGHHLASGADCTFVVSFAPTTSGQKNAVLQIAATNGGSFQIALSGLALAHPLVVTPPSKDFGSLPIGTTASATFRVSNPATKSAGPLYVGYYWEPWAFALTADSCSGTTLAPGGSCTVAVRYTATDAGPESGGFVVSTPGNASAVVVVSGS